MRARSAARVPACAVPARAVVSRSVIAALAPRCSIRAVMNAGPRPGLRYLRRDGGRQYGLHGGHQITADLSDPSRPEIPAGVGVQHVVYQHRPPCRSRPMPTAPGVPSFAYGATALPTCPTSRWQSGSGA